MFVLHVHATAAHRALRLHHGLAPDPAPFCVLKEALGRDAAYQVPWWDEATF